MKKFKSLILAFVLTLTLALPSVNAMAAENYNQEIEIQIDDTNLSRKESVIQFMDNHPEYKEQVMDVLKEKGALNVDGSIKDDLGMSNNMIAKDISITPYDHNNPIYTGYDYTYVNSGSVDIYPKETLAMYTNTTSSPKNFSVNQTFTVTTSTYTDISIGSKAKLDEVYEINAGVKMGYTLTQSASTQYGTQVTVPAFHTGILEASALKQCYVYREQYYILGIEIGSPTLIGVFKPTGVHWYYSEVRNN